MAEEVKEEVKEEVVEEGDVTTTETVLTEADPDSTLLTGEADKEVDPDAKDKDGETDESKPDGAPETYEDFTFPDGFEAVEAKIEAFKEIAKDANLTQADAQRLMDIHAEMTAEYSAKLAEEWNTVRKNWAKEAKSDKEYGGQKFNESMRAAKRALDTYGSPELIKTINETGIGDNPEFVRLMVKVGQTLGEDSTITGKGVGDVETDRAKKLFPNNN